MPVTNPSATRTSGGTRLCSKEYLTKKIIPRNSARPPTHANSFTPRNFSQSTTRGGGGGSLGSIGSGDGGIGAAAVSSCAVENAAGSKLGVTTSGGGWIGPGTGGGAT